jgi:aspartyl-tRNA(Asn)/glutamyl-tRNA(Gln) amidotransferase subunit A
MQATDLHYLTLAEAARLVRERAVSPVELTRTALERIERLDGRLRSFITVTAESALEEARRAEAAVGLQSALAPLHGVPIALKDLFDTAGVATTAGSRILGDRVPSKDATVVSRLRESGAVMLGKLNMHEFAFGVTTLNPHYGTCRNPWDTDRIPGGSSGGSGAAVAAGLCYGALGSDTGGSIRIPGSLCGIVGLKPTYGRVSRSGVLPLSWSLDHAGPMTRTVTDTALMLDAIAGHDPADPGSAAVPVPDYTATLEDGVRGLRVGLPRRYFFEQMEPAVERAVEDAVAVLRQAGAEVRDVEIEGIEHTGAAFAPIISVEAASYHARWLRECPQDYGADVLGRLMQGDLYPATQYVNAQRLRRTITDNFLATLSEVDVLMMPTMPVTAPRIPGPAVATPNPLTRNTFPFDVTGLPALTLPCGFDPDGLPIGLQIAGRPFDEPTVLRAARAYERATDWHTRHPRLED